MSCNVILKTNVILQTTADMFCITEIKHICAHWYFDTIMEGTLQMYYDPAHPEGLGSVAELPLEKEPGRRRQCPR